MAKRLSTAERREAKKTARELKKWQPELKAVRKVSKNIWTKSEYNHQYYEAKKRFNSSTKYKKGTDNYKKGWKKYWKNTQNYFERMRKQYVEDPYEDAIEELLEYYNIDADDYYGYRGNEEKIDEIKYTVRSLYLSNGITDKDELVSAAKKLLGN